MTPGLCAFGDTGISRIGLPGTEIYPDGRFPKRVPESLEQSESVFRTHLVIGNLLPFNQEMSGDVPLSL